MSGRECSSDGSSAQPPATAGPGELSAGDRRPRTRSSRRNGACWRSCVSEVAFFSTLIVTYVTFWARDTVGPTPRDALSLPLVIGMTVCLLPAA